MNDSVTQWLEQLGLGQYADAFEENAIEWDLFEELTDDDLRAIGIAALGHRKRLLKAISEIGESSETTVPLAPPFRVTSPFQTVRPSAVNLQ